MLDKLFIKIQLELDRMEQPFWCGYVVKEHWDGSVKKEDMMMEIRGDEVFQLTDQKKMMDQYERVFIRIAKELAKYPDQTTLFQMFIHNKVYGNS